MSNTWLIVGLGNPGEKYKNTRHNLGFMVVDHLAQKLGAGEWTEKFHGLLTKHGELLFYKPETYMNNSGEGLARIMQFYKLPGDNIVVVHDDADQPFGQVRVRFAGGDGGHNGVKSIDENIGNDYWRVKIGINHSAEHQELTDHVLTPFSTEEQRLLPSVIDQVTGKLLQYFENNNEITPETFDATQKNN